MSARSSTRNLASVHVVTQAHQAVTWSFTSRTAANAQRFAAAIDRAMALFPDGEVTPAITWPATFAARLICLDGVTVDQLIQLDEKGFSVYRTDEGVALEWTNLQTHCLERRLLSPLSVVAWREIQHVQSPGQMADATSKSEPSITLQGALRLWLHQTSVDLYPGGSLGELAADQTAWFSQSLPGPLFAHCHGALSLTALPRSALARRATGLALQANEVDQQDRSSEFETSRLLEAADHIGGPGVDSNLLRAALDTLRDVNGLSIDGQIKRYWVSRLNQLPIRHSGVSPLTVVMMGWLVHLCVDGTSATPNLAISTVKAYTSKLLQELAQAIHLNKAFDAATTDWDLPRLSEAYHQVLDSAIGRKSPVTAAALASFQSYLEQQFDVEPIALHISKQTKPVAVQANVIWPHEVDWCLASLSALEDNRIAQMAKLQLLIAAHAPVRHQDLVRLQIRNIAFANDALGAYLEIEIARDASRGRLKTVSSQRRLLIRAPRVAEAMAEWLNTRRREGCSSQALLFAKPTDDKSLDSPGKVRSLLSACLKAATGDPSTRLYDLRHTQISWQMAEVLSSCPCIDINPLEVIAAHAGHATPMTTLQSYTHDYETSLRLWLDHEILSQTQLTAAMMDKPLAQLRGKAPSTGGNTLIQKARRSGTSSAMVWWSDLHTEAQKIPCPSVAEDMKFETPRAMNDVATGSTSAITFSLALDAIYRTYLSQSPHTTAAALGLTEPRLNDLINDVCDWLAQLFSLHFPRIARKTPTRTQRDPNRLKDLVDRLGIDLQGCRSKLWSGITQMLNDQGLPPETDRILRFWQASGRGQYLSLEDASGARFLFTLLHKAKVPYGHIRVIAEKGWCIEGIETVVGEEIATAPITEWRSPRVDRPSSYLAINGNAQAPTTFSRQDQTASLKGLFVGLKALQILNARP